MARDIRNTNYYRGGLNLPVKWMSPEAIIEKKFTTKSDIWGFGVLIWEVMMLGQTPYPTMGPREVIKYVCQDAGHLDVPPLCPQPLTNYLGQCWAYNPDNRPDFYTLLEVLEQMLSQKEDYQRKQACSANVIINQVDDDDSSSISSI